MDIVSLKCWGCAARLSCNAHACLLSSGQLTAVASKHRLFNPGTRMSSWQIWIILTLLQFFNLPQGKAIGVDIGVVDEVKLHCHLTTVVHRTNAAPYEELM
eukprot:6467329-Amphidinium_carterae.2